MTPILPFSDDAYTPEYVANVTDWKALESCVIIAMRKDGKISITSSYLSPAELSMFALQFQSFATDAVVRGQWENG